jgi:hypothetical protein
MTDVRDMLIERIARWLVVGDEWAADEGTDLAADLLDQVFCDPEIRDAMADVGDSWGTNGDALWSELFGPVKETEQ